MQLRDAIAADLEPLATLWWRGWQDAHADILPAELAAMRTLQSFIDRTRDALPRIRILGSPGEPMGFHLLKGDELYQFYLAAEARGGGAAAVLMADALQALRANGVAVAWLACAIGNHRAARFYEKTGWRLSGVENVPTETAAGPFPLDVWRYEREVA